MVQLESTAGYDGSVEDPDPEQRRAAEPSLDQVVRGLLDGVSGMSRQFTAAAENFAGEAVRMIEGLASSAERWAGESRNSAREAERAAEDSRRLRTEIESAVDAARNLLQAEAASLGAQLRAEIGEATRASQENAASGRIAEDLVASREAAAAAEHAAEDARAAALEAMSHAAEARAPRVEPDAGREGRQLLDRLEADYQRLSGLAQELHARIAALGAGDSGAQPRAGSEEPFPAVVPSLEAHDSPADTEETPPELESWSRPAASNTPVDAGTTVPPLPSAESPSTPSQAWNLRPTEQAESADSDHEIAADAHAPGSKEHWAQSAALNPPATRVGPGAAASPGGAWEAAPGPAPGDPGAGSIAAAPALRGRVVVKVSPVPDFDRLLGLDGALGRLAFVQNVTLADYAREEVTFRIDLEGEVPAADFIAGLGDMCSQEFELVSQDAGELQLRVAQA